MTRRKCWCATSIRPRFATANLAGPRPWRCSCLSSWGPFRSSSFLLDERRTTDAFAQLLLACSGPFDSGLPVAGADNLDGVAVFPAQRCAGADNLIDLSRIGSNSFHRRELHSALCLRADADVVSELD